MLEVRVPDRILSETFLGTFRFRSLGKDPWSLHH